MLRNPSAADTDFLSKSEGGEGRGLRTSCAFLGGGTRPRFRECGDLRSEPLGVGGGGIEVIGESPQVRYLRRWRRRSRASNKITTEMESAPQTSAATT
jgi:hypothetical protein